MYLKLFNTYIYANHPWSVILYIFNNTVVVCAFLLFFLSTCLLIKNFLLKNFPYSFTNFLFIFLLVISLLVNFFQTHINYNEYQLSDKNKIERNGINLFKFIHP